MPRNNTEDLSKLPVWVQRKIKMLEANLEDSKTRMREMLGDETTSNVSIDRVMGQKFLPNNSRVSFYLENGNIIDVYNEGGGIKIRGAGRGNGALLIRPDSSNAIHVTIER